MQCLISKRPPGTDSGELMAMNGSTWRKHPFIIGNKYIARKDNPDFSLGNIASGQEYLLNYIGHSHYDGASIFTFKCLSSDELVGGGSIMRQKHYA